MGYALIFVNMVNNKYLQYAFEDSLALESDSADFLMTHTSEKDLFSSSQSRFSHESITLVA